MITSASSIFVGDVKTPADLMNVTATDVKSIFLEDTKGNIITTATAAAPFSIAQVEGIDVVDGANIARIRRSGLITAAVLKNSEYLAGVTVADTTAPVVEESVEVDFTAITVDPAERYVLRIQFKDLTYYNAGPAYYSHSYEVFGQDVTNAIELADAFRRQIIAQDGSRVNVNALGTAVVTITAKAKDNSNGLWPLNDWAQVTFVASIYKTSLRDSVLYNNYYEAVPGVTITTLTSHDRGKGYWKDVRDLERHSMAARGYTNQTTWFIEKPTLFTEEGATYNVLSIDFERQYKSADNQFTKMEPVTVTIANNSATGTGFAALITNVKTLLGL
ncbi:hypothetical protein AGMMS50239_36720 [Bacteroidia bacterium]|nr:hypothetical protein AGMMS50239_36720 [Bacteroidia bacterium]